MTRLAAIAGLIALIAAMPTVAEEFRVIDDRPSFLSLVEGRQLTRLGIKLDVRNSGKIEGRAFGMPVTGAWSWSGGYFCRDLSFGNQDLGQNCQQIKVMGSTLRFIADRGQGHFADLSIR